MRCACGQRIPQAGWPYQRCPRCEGARRDAALSLETVQAELEQGWGDAVKAFGVAMLLATELGVLLWLLT
jgi:hypothetical protein